MDAGLFRDEGIFTVQSSKCRYDFLNADDTNQIRVFINNDAKEIEVYFWEDYIAEPDKEVFDEQIVKLENVILEYPEFEGYSYNVEQIFQ